MRMELALDDDGMHLIEELKVLTGLKTNKEFFNNAVTLFDWAVLQVMLGRTLVSFDDKKADPRELVMPALQYAGRLKQSVKVKALANRLPESGLQVSAPARSIAAAG